MDSALNSGDTAWVLASAALVLIMIPGLAFFYGGMLRSKTVLNMLMMVMGALFIVGVLWVAYGYSVAFGGDPESSPLLGSFSEFAFLNGLMADNPEASLPVMAFVAFQAMFACITVGLIAGSVADRMKFSAWMVFSALWATLVYFPVAHWVWASGGWIFQLGVIDFAGGTAVHINAGAAGLALAIVLGRRLGWPKTPMKPSNLPLVMIGAGLLWFGWFGFNAGSELAADGTAALVWVNTTVATCAAMMGWLALEKIRDGHFTSIGAASGVVAGLVAITPACGALSPMGSIILGLVAGAASAYAVGLKFRFGFDDSLDVVGVHLVAGLWGTIGAGLLSTTSGLFYGEGVKQTVIQIVVALASLIVSGVVTAVIAYALKATMGWRVSSDDETAGIDNSEHAETAYDLVARGGRLGVTGSGPVHDARHHTEPATTEGVTR